MSMHPGQLEPPPADAEPREEPAPPAPRPSSRRPSLPSRLGEWFWRRRALEGAAKVDEADRRDTAALLDLSEQRAEAAETLWTTGHLAEALRLVADAFASATELPSDPTTLHSLGVRTKDVAQVAAARELASVDAPDRDGALDASHTQRYLTLRGAQQTIAQAHRARIATRRSILWQRVQRVGSVLGGFAAIAVIVWLFARTPPRVDVRASDQFPGTQYAPENAFDDNESTEWVLPDETAGWIEARLIPPRDIERVRVLNGRNSHFGDRATKEYEVQLFRGGELLGEHEGSFPRIEASPQWVDVPLSGQNVSRIRFVVAGHHRKGGALAELAWDE